MIIGGSENGFSQEFEAKLVKDELGVIWNEVRIFDQGKKTFDAPLYFRAGQTSSQTPTGTIEYIDPVGSGITTDAWGKQKTSMDRSLVHGMFTFNVPVTLWKETFNGTERVITNTTSVDGKLRLESGATLADDTVLDTYRNPRYQPNRGHLYAFAGHLPSPNANGTRRFGTATEESGAFFELRSDGSLHAVVRTTVSAATSDDDYVIDTTGIDLSLGNTYDIQFQWRGVGNYFFYINQRLVKIIKYLGARTELTMFNPANPIMFQCINGGDNVVITGGCVDVSSEGGESNGNTYGSISMDNQAGQVAISGYNVPMIAMRSKKTVNSLRNTRDTLMLLLTGYSDQRSFLRVWATRDFTAITENDQSWTDYGDGHLEYIAYDIPNVASPMTFDTGKASLIFGCRVDIDNAYSTSALFEGRTDIWMTPGDMLIFTMHRETGGSANAGCTIEFGEQI